MKSRTWRLLLIVLLFVLGGCAYGPGLSSTTSSTAPSAQSGGPARPTAEKPAAPAADGYGAAPTAMPAASENTAAGETSVSGAPNTIEVSLTEFKIDMPATLPAGPIVFVAKNNGNYKHSLKIEGQGIEQRLDADLSAGAEGKLQVELVPGTYRIYCPIGNHAERGMDIEVTVTEAG